MSRIADRGLRISDLGGAQLPREADDLSALSTQHPAPSASLASIHNPQSAIRNPQSIELHIEELVLHGFAPGDRHLVGDAVQRELARSLTEEGVPSSLMQDIEIARLDGGAFQVAPSSRPQSIGRQVARSIYGGLKK